ncbi:MAG: hypothetical protein ABW250_22530 [Pyrinomonadaceae bacterium]
MLDMTPRPYLQFVFLCDDIVQHEDREIDVIHLVTHLLFMNDPPRMPPSPFSAKVVVGIGGGDRFSSYPLLVTMVGTDGSESPLWDTAVGFTGEEYSPIKVQQFDFTFLEPGTYWFNVYLEGRPAGRYPVTVEYMPAGTS